jgi:RNA polymerase sigma factor (TIGR02999 family)
MLAAMDGQASQVAGLLAAWRDGDRTALDRLLPLIRPELHRLARRHLAREAANHTMQASSLVQEAFLRLLPSNAGWRDRAHFFAVASRVMRHVLVDHARSRKRVKRGRGAPHLALDDVVVLSPARVDEIVAIDLALDRLAETDARKARVFELRFFGGMTVEETAEVLGVAPNTVVRDWNFSRAWLRRELSEARTAGCAPHRPD